MNTPFKYKILFSFVKSGRLTLDERVDESFKHINDLKYTKYGFYWWFWLPAFNRNNGRFSKSSQCVHFNVNWLCFGATIYFWRK